MRPSAQLARRGLVVGLLALLAVWATLHSPTIFFDNQILLGPSLGVFALLEFGWLGLPVGIAAALCTVPLWGHPWAALVLILQLVWQLLFLRRFNGGAEQRGNGRIVLATIVFWLAVGWPLNSLLYTSLLQVDLQSTTPLVLKEAVVSVVNASLALLLYLGLQIRRVRRGPGDLPLRGLAFATQLLMISLPGILIITAMGQQITAQALGQYRLSLEQKAQTIALLLPAGSSGLPADPAIRQRLQGVAFEAVAADGRRLVSDPALFTRLRTRYWPDRHALPGVDQGLYLWVESGSRSVLERHLQGFWRYQITLPETGPNGWRRISVVQPARAEVRQLIGMMRPALQILGLLLIGAALVSEAFTSLLAAQFNRILGPLTRMSGSSLAMPELQATGIRELNRIVAAINRQGRTVNQLSRELQESHERLRQSEEQHRLLADNSLDVITLCDLEGRPTYISPSIERMRGWTVAEALALPIAGHLTPEGCATVQRALEDSREAQRRGQIPPDYRVELQQSHKNGSWIWTDVTSTPMLNETGAYIGTLVVYRDITERKRLEAELLNRASVDDLTQLLTRRELLSRLEPLLAEARRRRVSESLALLFCDLDLFKDINDNLGHAAGDAVLRGVAQRIRGAIRDGDLAARMGGDELVVVLTAVADLEAAMAVARKLGAAIAEPINGPDFSAMVTASIGVTMARPGESVDALMARADRAMYRAKQGGRNRVVQLDPGAAGG